MKKKIMSTIIVATMLTVLFASMANASPTSAEAPQWSVGDRWGFGADTDLNEYSQPYISEMKQEVENSPSVSSIDATVSGKAGAWATVEVTTATETEYTLHYRLSESLDNLKVHASVTGQMPEEGTYSYSETPSMANKTMSVDVSLDHATVLSGDMHLLKDTMAVKSITMDVEQKTAFNLKGKNLPGEDTFMGGMMGGTYDSGYEYGFDGNHTISYKDYDISMTEEFHASVTMNFDPPLNLLDFPINVGDEWHVHSNVTASGTYGGSIDAKGLPDDMVQEIKNETGQDFPIDIAKIDTGSSEVNNGVIRETDTIDLDLKCTGTMSITDETGNTITVFKIGPNYDYYGLYRGDDSEPSLLYSPDRKFIAGTYIPAGSSPFASGMSGSMGLSLPGTTAITDTKFTYTDYDTASSNIDKTDSQMSSLGKPSLVDFSNPIFLAVILGVVILIVVLALVMRKKGPKEPQMAPPDPYAPQQPPQPYMAQQPQNYQTPPPQPQNYQTPPPQQNYQQPQNYQTPPRQQQNYQQPQYQQPPQQGYYQQPPQNRKTSPRKY